MNILIAASEAFPFCKTGGLGDVVGALARVLSQTKGHKVALFLPKYRNVGGGLFSLRAMPGSFRIPMRNRVEAASLSHVRWGNVDVYFVDSPRYFDRAGLYRTRAGDYADNDDRYIFFSRCVLEGAKFVDFKPDVIHCHDWQTGLIPAYLKTLYSIDSFFSKTASVFTVHNMAYQGVFGRDTLFNAGFGWSEFTPDRLEYYGGINFLKSGLVFAEIIAAVSPAYAREIQTPAEGKGLEGVLKARSDSLCGVLNGIDTEVWNPEIDSFLARGYDDLSVAKGKPVCKKALQKECGLEAKPGTMLAGIVSRLERHKGLDLVAKIIPDFIESMQFAILGVGDAGLQEIFSKLAGRYPGRVFFKAAFDEVLAHKIYAGSDLFIMPSRFEPCGLGQLIAMRYGAIPLVNKTGGLADTVFGAESGDRQNGFLMASAAADALCAALKSAQNVFRNPSGWQALVRTAMKGDYSWDKSAGIYLDLYEKAVRKVR